jgi:flagellar biosynthesis protein FlhB
MSGQGDEDDADKEFDASQKKLDEARARGEVTKSMELNAAAAYAGLAFACLLAGSYSIIAMGNAGIALLGQADRLAPIFMNAPAAPMAAITNAFALGSLPLFAAPAVTVLLALILQRAIVFAPEKLAFQLSRISPIATAKQKFGVEGLVEFAKNSLKMIVIGILLGLYLQARAAEILTSLYLDVGSSMELLMQFFLEFLFLVVLISAVFGGLDYFWQSALHAKRNRMSRKEMLDEMKDTEGDPHVKHQRRARGQEIATNRMLADVPKADVIVVNPTHYAVALKWNKAAGAAPICVAKGVDEVAARIREAAGLAGVPIHSDPPTARALYAAVRIGDQILPEHYRAVATAIRFAERMRRKAREMGKMAARR